MKIKRYETGQFAGISDRSIEFSDGMNVIIGDNEAGKSTMLAGIYSTLFQPYDSKKSSSGYKNFVELYKPSGQSIEDGIYIDGDVCLDIAGHEVKVSKTWLSEASTRVYIDGVGYKAKGAEEKLSELMRYGAAFYGNVVFGLQSNEELVLKWMFDETDAEGKLAIKKKMSEYASVIGGVDIDKFQYLLKEKMSELDGRWDFELNAPMKDRGRIKDLNDPWKNSVGKILETYYIWKRSLCKLDDIRGKVIEIQRLEDDLILCEQEQKKLQHRLDYILENKVNLHNRKANGELLERVKKELHDIEKIILYWPEAKNELHEIMELVKQQTEQEKRLYRESLRIKLEEVREMKEKLSGIDIGVRDVRKLDKAYAEAERLTARLEIMEQTLLRVKLKAYFKPKNGTVIEVESADGLRTVDGEETVSLNGYIRVDIPEVAEVVIDTDGLDSGKIKAEISEAKEKLCDIYSLYNVKGLKKLDEYRRRCNEQLVEKQRLEEGIRNKLGDTSFGELERALLSYKIDEDIDIYADFEDRIKRYYVRYSVNTLDAVKALVEKRILEYEAEYKDEESLKCSIEKKKKEKLLYEKRLSEIPELEETGDYEQLEESLRESLAELSERYKLGFQLKSRLAAEIDEMNIDELKDEVCLYEEEHNKQLEQYRIYSCIERDFNDIRDNMNEKPTDKLMDKMAAYLGDITLNGVQIESMGDDLQLELTSKGKPVNSYKLLSEGTKSTLIISFKLAVLDFFFEEEGGLIVLDDILLDMDPLRRKKSAQLLRKFAESNQVIFMTCDPDMAKLLGGNLIEL